VRTGGIGEREGNLVNFGSSREMEQIVGYLEILRTAWQHGLLLGAITEIDILAWL